MTDIAHIEEIRQVYWAGKRQYPRLTIRIMAERYRIKLSTMGHWLAFRRRAGRADRTRVSGMTALDHFDFECILKMGIQGKMCAVVEEYAAMGVKVTKPPGSLETWCLLMSPEFVNQSFGHSSRP